MEFSKQNIKSVSKAESSEAIKLSAIELSAIESKNIFADVSKDIWAPGQSSIANKKPEIQKAGSKDGVLPRLELLEAGGTPALPGILNPNSASSKIHVALAQPQLQRAESKTDLKQSIASTVNVEQQQKVARLLNNIQYQPPQTGRSEQALRPTPAPLTDTATLNPADLHRWFEANFDRLNTDGNQFISDDEIDHAVLDQSFQGRDAQMLSALKVARDELEELRNDEFGDEDDGITRGDMNEFNRQVVETTTANKIKEFTNRNFTVLDRDHDGYIAADELTASLRSSRWTADERSTISAMASRICDIEEVSNDEWGDENDGITRADMAAWHGGENQELITLVDQRLDRSQQILDRTDDRSLYNPSEPNGGVNPSAIRQDVIGDCYFLAALASVANTNPQAIRDMIRDNGNGTYTVTFPGASDEPITVTSPTDTELSLYNENTNNGIWACVMEKAYGAYCNEHFYRRSPLHSDESIIPQEGADEGSLFADGLRILTGGGVDNDLNTFTSYSTMDRKLREAFADHRPVTAVAIAGDSQYNIASMHEYSVLGYDSRTRTITIRNPWAHGEPAGNGPDDGIFTMTLEQFNTAFAGLNYAEQAV